MATGATALYLGTADLTPLRKGSASAAGLEANLPAGLFAVRGNYRGDDDSAASWSLPVNVSSGLVSRLPHQTLPLLRYCDAAPPMHRRRSADAG